MRSSRLGNLQYAAGKVSDRGPEDYPGAQESAMDFAIVAVAEKLAAEFPHQSSTTVLRVVAGCVEQFPDDGMFVEDAARAHLTAAGDRVRAAMTEQDPLDVSLEDTELLTEVKMLTDLIVAATPAEDLGQDEIDQILDIRR